MKYFFIVGCPRSGTTVLQQALNRHSRIVIAPETRFFFLFGRRTTRGQQFCLERINRNCKIDLTIRRRIRGESATRTFYEEFTNRYIERLGRAGVTHFGEKSPEHMRRLHRIFEVLPEAKIILIHRDGRDVALSLTKVPWMHRELSVNFAVWLYYYKIQRRLVERCDKNIYIVKYEEFVRTPEFTLRRLLDFLGLPYEPATAEGHGNRDGIPDWEYTWKAAALEKISDARIGMWVEQLGREEIRNLEIWGREALVSLGYEVETPVYARLPATFFPKLYWRILTWRTRLFLHTTMVELLSNPRGTARTISPMGSS